MLERVNGFFFGGRFVRWVIACECYRYAALNINLMKSVAKGVRVYLLLFIRWNSSSSFEGFRNEQNGNDRKFLKQMLSAEVESLHFFFTCVQRGTYSISF